MAKLTPVKKAILKTLAYRDVFDFPLTGTEVHKFLVGESASPLTVDETLKQLVTKEQVGSEDGYFFLPGRKEVVALRRRREEISKGKLKKTQRYADLFRSFPWVEAIFASGAAAVENADEESDLDVLVVTAPRRLWLSRFWIFFILNLLGVKKPHDGIDVKDKVCANILLAETALAVPKEEQNLYTAHEVVNLRPIWEKKEIHRRFLAENGWVKDYLPNVELPSFTSSSEPCGSALCDQLEKIGFSLQCEYMRKRQTREITTPERILFHRDDKTEPILAAYEKGLAALSLDKD
jgi:predicted nucleotidyltransferase